MTKKGSIDKTTPAWNNCMIKAKKYCRAKKDRLKGRTVEQCGMQICGFVKRK